jgi:hypothetical protein
VLLGCLVVCGCGQDANAPKLVPVSGTVTLDDKPLSGAVLTFTPTGDTRGGGATGRTGPDGKYTLKEPRGGSGAVAGAYKVVISKRVMPDGSDVPADYNVPEMDSPARETLPAHYSSPEQTTLIKTVPPEGGTVDFALKGRKR